MPNSSRAWLRWWTDGPASHVLVTGADDEPMGGLALRVAPRVERDGWWAQIVALVTRQSARRQGIGRRLVRRAEAIAAAAGCDTMILPSSRERGGAHEFYRSLGYRDRRLDHARFVRSLS